ncbi:MAG: hypothetical protein EOO60_06245 [Hymenobacter sp.]|nr:MAG: hypothetical protein EOO60_06245 [Hymenobacter sp.]
MSHLPDFTRPAEQIRELQQLEQLGAVVNTTDFKLRMRAHLVAEAAAHHTPLIYRDAAGQLVEEWIGFGELAPALSSAMQQVETQPTHAFPLAMPSQLV